MCIKNVLWSNLDYMRSQNIVSAKIISISILKKVTKNFLYAIVNHLKVQQLLWGPTSCAHNWRSHVCTVKVSQTPDGINGQSAGIQTKTIAMIRKEQHTQCARETHQSTSDGHSCCTLDLLVRRLQHLWMHLDSNDDNMNLNEDTICRIILFRRSNNAIYLSYLLVWPLYIGSDTYPTWI